MRLINDLVYGRYNLPQITIDSIYSPNNYTSHFCTAPFDDLATEENLNNDPLFCRRISGTFSQMELTGIFSYTDVFIDRLTKTGKRFGFDSSIVTSFLEDHTKSIVPLCDSMNNVGIFNDLPDFGNALGLSIKDLKSEEYKVRCLFLSYIINYHNQMLKHIKRNSSKPMSILQSIDSFKYFKSQLN